MRSVWLNRTQALWPEMPPADLIVRSLDQLADMFDAMPVNHATSRALA